MFLYDRWYTAAQSTAITNTPVKICILEEPITMFRLKCGDIVALEDKCPHRHAPLSRGEIKNDTIQCAYHGLRYDKNGTCVHIPTQEHIPENLKVKKYTAIERHGLIFIWMKRQFEPQDQLFYEFPWEENEDWQDVFLQFDTKFNYRLLVDNLMDLSHLGYLHKSTIGIAAVAENARQQTIRDGEKVKVIRQMLNIDQAPTHLALTGYDGKVDRWQSIEFCPPGYFWVQTGTAITRKGVEDATGNNLLIKRNSVHMVVPKSKNSTSYFYKTVHKPYQMTDKQKKLFEEQMRNTFMEDIDLLNEISAGNTWSEQKIDVAADSGAVQAQKMLDSLISAQCDD